MTVEVPIVLAVIGSIATFVGAWFAWRGQRAIAYAAQTDAAVNALSKAVEVVQAQSVKNAEEAAELKGKMSVLEGHLVNATRYEALLIDHINLGKPPPPPARPA